MEKLCAFCRHFGWDLDFYDYGGQTGAGLSGGASCRKRRFEQTIPYDMERFRDILLTAETCPDYTPASGS